MITARIALLFVAVCAAGCANNPIKGKREPAEAMKMCLDEMEVHKLRVLYEEDGHLYTTLRQALEAGYEERALMLAYYSQYPDIDVNYEATPVAIKYLLLVNEHEWRNAITGVLHSLHGGDSSAIRYRREKVASQLKETLRDKDQDWLSGLLIHALGDAYAHTKNEYLSEGEKAYGKWIGHAIPNLLCRSPDDICGPGNLPKYTGYVAALRKVLNDRAPSSGVIYGNEKDTPCDYPNRSFRGPRIDWADVTGQDLEGKPTAKFVHCMNQNSRPLTRNEIMRSIRQIQDE